MQPDRISEKASLATARWLASRRASLFAYGALSQAFSLQGACDSWERTANGTGAARQAL